MKLSPLRFALLLAVTLVLSACGIVLMALGVHGTQILTWLGGFLLLPSVLLAHFGMPIAIPFLYSMSAASIVVFIALQMAYYCVLYWFCRYVRRARRQPTSR